MTTTNRSFPTPHPRARGRMLAGPELIAPIAKQKRFRILEHFRGQTYIRSETGWELERKAFTFEPITGRLEAEVLNRLTREDHETDDPADLVRRAWLGLALGHHDRAAGLTRRVLRSLIRPPDKWAGGDVLPDEWRQEGLAAAAMLCSALRRLRDSEAALQETEVLAAQASPALMTSRAAAMCDVGRWDEAKVLALRARDIQASEENSKVLGRIDRHFDSESLAASY